MADAPTRQIAIFPLSTVVLFPQTRVPLHIFEPRYRQMMTEALAGDRLLGMVAVLPEHGNDMAGNPPTFPIGCAGFISEYQQLADGRFDLVLQGAQRFRIQREHPPEAPRLFRIADVEMLDETLDESFANGFPERRDRVLESLACLARHQDAEADLEGSLARLSSLPDDAFTNALCAVIGLPAIEKQGLLEANGVSTRLERLEDLLQFHLAETRGLPADSRVIH